jgi:hypothetical protein
MTSHIFDCDEAKKYGVDEAIILANLKYWLDKNKANEKNLNDDHYWTYNSVKAFGKLFDYWSSRQIQRILKSLADQGVLIEGNYNKSTYDRTKWYTLNASHYPEYSIAPNGQMEDTKPLNGITQTVQPIPNSKLQIVNSDSKPVKKESTKEASANGFVTFWSKYPNKKNKAQAVKAFNKLSSANQRLAIDGVDGYLGTVTQDKFICHASTYLNNARWEDQENTEAVDDYSWADGNRVSDHTNVIEGEVLNG